MQKNPRKNPRTYRRFSIKNNDIDVRLVTDTHTQSKYSNCHCICAQRVIRKCILNATCESLPFLCAAFIYSVRQGATPCVPYPAILYVKYDTGDESSKVPVDETLKHQAVLGRCRSYYVPVSHVHYHREYSHLVLIKQSLLEHPFLVYLHERTLAGQLQNKQSMRTTIIYLDIGKSYQDEQGKYTPHKCRCSLYTK